MTSKFQTRILSCTLVLKTSQIYIRFRATEMVHGGMESCGLQNVIISTNATQFAHKILLVCYSASAAGNNNNNHLTAVCPGQPG